MVERVTGIEPASRAWKARPVPSPWPDATPMAQVKAGCCRPLLTVSDRQLPMLRARGGHGRRGRSWLRPGGDGHKLNRRVRLVSGDHLPRWQVAVGGAAGVLRGGLRPEELQLDVVGIAEGDQVVLDPGVGDAQRGESFLPAF
jgi:hypothetical protein